MAINRAAAFDFAKRFWNRPCDDGIFWTADAPVSIAQKRRELRAPESDGWEALFIPNGEGEDAVFQKPSGDTKLIQGWKGLDDCAHYLCRCLHAEGIVVNRVSVGELVRDQQARSDTKTLGEKVAKDKGQLIVNSGVFKKGDMIGYFEKKGVYGHSAMYAGKLNDDDSDVGRITCHSVCRFPGLSDNSDNSWDLGQDYRYTFIHFSNDDPHAASSLTGVLTGWWRVEFSGKTKFYFIHKDGRAHSTRRAPTEKTPELHVGDDSAYSFEGPDGITFTWRLSGDVEVWSKGEDDREFDIQLNDDDSTGKATKLF